MIPGVLTADIPVDVLGKEDDQVIEDGYVDGTGLMIGHAPPLELYVEIVRAEADPPLIEKALCFSSVPLFVLQTYRFAPVAPVGKVNPAHVSLPAVTVTD